MAGYFEYLDSPTCLIKIVTIYLSYMVFQYIVTISCYVVPIISILVIIMTPTQCKMARVAVGWGVRDLARNCDVSPNTVNRFENGKDAYQSTVEKLKSALESTGKIRFEGDECVCVT